MVQNESAADVDVYLWDGWNRATRLGSVAAGDTVNFEVPEAVSSAAGPYHLEARAAQGNDSPAQSEQFALRAGYRITWAIPAADAVGAAPADVPTDTGSSRPGQ